MFGTGAQHETGPRQACAAGELKPELCERTLRESQERRRVPISSMALARAAGAIALAGPHVLGDDDIELVRSAPCLNLYIVLYLVWRRFTQKCHRHALDDLLPACMQEVPNKGSHDLLLT
jgi:hypothetical protein